MYTAVSQVRPQIKTTLPGPKAEKIIQADSRYITPSYPRPYELVVERANGVWVEDVDGNIFLDCNAGVAVCATGHCHPEIVRVIQEQAEKLIHICGTDYYYDLMPALAKKLDEIVPVPSPTRTHFANSGTEAVETALKLAMHATGRERFIAFFNSFHGRTLGSLSLTSSKTAQRKGFRRQLLDVTHVPFPNHLRCPFHGGKPETKPCLGSLEWIEERIFNTTLPPEECAAIVVECVQGEGGYLPAPKEFLEGLRRICDTHGILLIVDEVQSGFGRTGKMFASDHYNLKPDIICLAKGIASGLPLGACVARADLMDWQPGAHASTFGGNPVALAASLKTIELLENGLIQNSKEVGDYLQSGLKKVMDKYQDHIVDVRGLGLMVGVEFVESRKSMKPARELRNLIERKAFQNGLILLGAGHSTIRWSPPLILTKENADVAVEIFDQVIGASL